MECPLIDLANVPQDQRYGSTENGKTKQMEEGSSEGCGNLQKTNTSGQGAASKCGMGFVGFVAVAILALGEPEAATYSKTLRINYIEILTLIVL
eukprot:m.207242 g.207242  ORF g.207242 m.207242 type:complete len:94 (+) comp39694_c0_seq8:168-449(+)